MGKHLMTKQLQQHLLQHCSKQPDSQEKTTVSDTKYNQYKTINNSY